MGLRRGTSVTVAASLGHAGTSSLTADTTSTGDDLGSAGFVSRWPDDLALLSDVGVTDLRLSFDWARLQPRPGDLSSEWVEWYGDVVDAARAVGVSIWACLLDRDRGVPQWLDNEGGLADVETIVRWWPRWLERVADEFGDRVDGWIPAVHAATDLPTPAWRDSWGLLRSDSPVTLSLRHGDLDRAEERRGSFDVVGTVIDVSVADDAIDDVDERLRLAGDRWAEQLGRADDFVDGGTPIVSDLALDGVDADLVGAALERFLDVAEPNGPDGDAAAEVAFVGPMVDPDDGPALFDPGRAIRPDGATYLGVTSA